MKKLLDKVFAAFVLPLLLLFSSKAGAAGAGLTGALLTAEMLVSQAPPTPEGVPTWLAAMCVGIGPAAAWLFTRFVASFGALYTVRARVKRKRVTDMLALEAAERGPDSGGVMKALLDDADEAEARAAALEAWKLPKTSS